ncbi:MAG: AAA family ATPase [Chloroflexi bacterium]|nr:AAA family ATPase [Chloroflexota bacterium]MBT3669736.1 AAA family ATPase [Chloroflexota bacterium]MBT4305216.1 AAA family ATPase [Chloroflexota bacterium]MBT4534861.1 AAA family ATPase [Chloroflexota bacterium]MBT4683945.1 AAA family ATPase [Chloroflexota bacterium]
MAMLKILFIDPDITSSKFLAFTFGKLDYKTGSTDSGTEGLVAAYRDQPEIIIIDPVITDIPIEELMDKLRRDKRTAHSKIIALSSITEPGELQNAIDLNFDRFLSKGPDILEVLKQAILELVDDGQDSTEELGKRVSGFVYSEDNIPSMPHNCKTIVLASAKGGTGTSTVCANMASMFAKLKPKANIVILDLVLPIGSIAPIVGSKDNLNIVEASLMSAAEITPGFFGNKLPFIENWGFKLLAGATSPKEANNCDISRIPIIIESLKNEFDYLFIDIGKSLSRISIPVITHSDQVIMILGLDQATVTLTKTVLDFLRGEGQNRQIVYPLINRAVGLEGLPKREVDEIIGYEITGNLPYIRGEFSLANNSNLPIHKKFPDNIVPIALREISQKILQRLEEIR